MTNATETLRRLLNERSEPYTTNDDMGCRETSWRGFTAYQLTPNSKLIMHPTPEQAIAATLGGGECEIETTESWLPAERYHRCKHCGAFFAVLDASGDIPPCVCPNCGKAVKR